MRNFLVIIFLSLTLSLSGATYYVATNGSDSNPGTLAQPWLTIQKGFSSISPGDILYIRGGTYSPSGSISGGQISGAVANGKKGTATNMYKVFAYPGEYPVLDCRNITNTSNARVGIYLVNSDYWHIKGIEITRVDQNQYPVLRGQGLLIQSGNFNKIENVTAHHNGGPGLELRENCEGNLFLNCDAYSNYDPYSGTPGDDADGFDIGFIAARSGNDRVNTLIGCRSWLNSDDGYDMYQYPGYHGIYILKDCWAWKNGYKTDGVSQAGDGNGFKYGADNNYSYDAVVRRTSTGCIAYANRQRGFSQEAANVKMLFYNNIAYQNGTWGFSFYDYDNADILRNNVSYKNPNGTIQNQGTKRVHDHNSWDSKVTLSDADFASLDASQLSLPRKSDGSLPDMSFLHLATGSDLVDAGVNVALSYSGGAPDLGAFEVNSGPANTAPRVTITSPGNNSVYSVSSNITITADVSDAEGTISLVEFYNGSTRLGTKSSAPYVFTWNTVPQGSYSIYVRATDNQGATATSSPISVKVGAGTTPSENQLPSVSISSPTKGNTFEEPAAIEIEVAASDPDGSVTKVTLFNGTEFLAELTSAPYSYSWKDIAAGNYQIKAVATDNSNATSTSTLVEFSVGHKPTYDPLSEIVSLYPNPNNGRFTIEFLVPLKSAKSEVVISDLNGNIVQRETVAPEETSKEIIMGKARSGLYILTVFDDAIIVTKKIIIK
jgi:hypothetical protein